MTGGAGGGLGGGAVGVVDGLGSATRTGPSAVPVVAPEPEWPALPAPPAAGPTTPSLVGSSEALSSGGAGFGGSAGAASAGAGGASAGVCAAGACEGVTSSAGAAWSAGGGVLSFTFATTAWSPIEPLPCTGGFEIAAISGGVSAVIGLSEVMWRTSTAPAVSSAAVAAVAAALAPIAPPIPPAAAAPPSAALVPPAAAAAPPAPTAALPPAPAAAMLVPAAPPAPATAPPPRPAAAGGGRAAGGAGSAEAELGDQGLQPERERTERRQRGERLGVRAQLAAEVLRTSRSA